MQRYISEDWEKRSKTEAVYTDTPPEGVINEGRLCKNCALFNSEKKTCNVVKGMISPEGTSMLFTSQYLNHEVEYVLSPEERLAIGATLGHENLKKLNQLKSSSDFDMDLKNILSDMTENSSEE